jgi:undecaprenyl-diphosphatase
MHADQPVLEKSHRKLGLMAGVASMVLLAVLLCGTTAHAAILHAANAASNELTVVKAIVLGAIEGVTEFLPISSTGHLLVAERLLHVGQKAATKDATDTYTVVIQLGAILAVLVVSWKRVLTLFQGLVGKSESGRTILVSLIAAFVPTAIIGLVLDKPIEEHFLNAGVVAAAWIVGGLAILVLTTRYRAAQTTGRNLESIFWKHGLIIGLSQSISVVWPGTSRSLVTILAAVLLGYSLSAAVEFSFILGLATLGAASIYKLAKDGSVVFDTFGVANPLIGIAVAFITALIAVKWMIAYLHNNNLTVFAFYRIAAGLLTLGLIASSRI